MRDKKGMRLQLLSVPLNHIEVFEQVSIFPLAQVDYMPPTLTTYE